MTRHRDFTGVKNHVPHAYEYADATTREAATGFVPADVGKLALQLDDFSFWVLSDDDPETWVQIGGSAIAADIDIGALTEETTPASGDWFIMESGGVRKKVDSDNLPGGGAGGIAWNQVVNESGASFANFTGTVGTWSSDGTVIKNTDAGGTVHRARYNTRLMTNAIIVEAELKTVSAGTNRTGLLIGYDGTNTGGIAVYISEGDNKVYVEQDGIVAVTSFSVTIAPDTFYKLRVVAFGREISIYLDGTLIGCSSLNSLNITGFIGLYSYTVESHFKNIKAWNLNGFPA